MKVFLTTSRMIFVGSIFVGFIGLGACKPPAQKPPPKLQKAEPPAAQQVAKPVVQAPARPSAKSKGDWNGAQIDWQDFAQGLQLAQANKKPICLVFSTSWCPHCRRYSQVFKDPQVVAQAKSFVMIHLDKDQNKELSRRFSPDGEYIPRTFFLAPDGQLDASIQVSRPKYKYFYDEKNPQSLLGGMHQALEKYK